MDTNTLLHRHKNFIQSRIKNVDDQEIIVLILRQLIKNQEKLQDTITELKKEINHKDNNCG